MSTKLVLFQITQYLPKYKHILFSKKISLHFIAVFYLVSKLCCRKVISTCLKLLQITGVHCVCVCVCVCVCNVRLYKN